MMTATNMDLCGSMKLRTTYKLVTEAMSALDNILRDLAIWVPHPDDDCSIGFVHKDELAEVEWAFDGLLDTLTVMEGASWHSEPASGAPREVVEHLERALKTDEAVWLNRWTVTCMERVREAALAQATAPCGNTHPASSNPESAATAERLMEELSTALVLGIYTFMLDSRSWDRGLHHYEVMDVLDALDLAKVLVGILYTHLVAPEGVQVLDVLNALSDAAEDALEDGRGEMDSMIEAALESVAAAAGYERA
jgi:hypothetical protein